MRYKGFRFILSALAIPVLHGCAAAMIAGGATGAGIAIDKRTTGTMVEDQAIEFKTASAFRDDPDINAQAHWNVTSYNTHVLITGEAVSEGIRQRMIDAARKIPKVTQVYNELTIAAPSSMMSRSSDTVITGKVKSKLLADKETEGLYVKVVTEKGVVYLMGLVSRHQADLATEIARQTGGVQKVVKLFEYTD